MNMLRTIEEVEEVEEVINGVDSPSLMSVDSTEPVKTVADSIDVPDGEKEEVAGEIKLKVEDKLEDKTSVEEEKEEKKPDAEKKVEVDKELAAKETDSKKVQKRIGKLTKQWRTAERERDLEREKRVKVETKLEELSSKIPAEGRPKKEDFDEEDDYIEALTDWKIDAKLNASQKKKVEKTTETEEKDQMLEMYDALDTVVENGKEKYDDFSELTTSDTLILTAEVAQIALDTEDPEDVLYYLASNPDVSETISGLDPIRIAKELGKIEAMLESKVKDEDEDEIEAKPEPKTKLPKKQSKAPAPIQSVRTDGLTEKDPNKMSPKEYRTWRENQKK